MNPAPLQLMLTFDAEADVFDRSIAVDAERPPQWRGIDEGIPLIREALAGRDVKATWFVRADNEIAAWHGDPAYLLRQYGHLWRSFEATGSEIGFHPHFSRESFTDPSGASHRKELHESLVAVRAAGFSPSTSRMGEAFGSNALMAALSEAGFQVDSTAMPGRVRRDTERCLDWSGTPTEPYHPALEDYRKAGEPSHPLLEIPMSIVPVKAEYDSAPFPRYVDLSFRHSAIRAGLQAHLCDASTLVSITHPSTVVDGVATQRHGLLSFDIEEFRRNLDFIFDECQRLGRTVQSITLGAYARRPALFPV